MLTTSGRGTPQSNARTRADEDQKGIVLGRMVELNTSLGCLDISRMKLTDDDAAHLIRALDVNTTLKSVSAATVGSGRVTLAVTLLQAATLTGGRCCEQLSLAANQLHWPAGTAFGKFLARNTSLEELDLSGNELHNEGVYSFR